MIVIHALDAEAHAQISGALGVADFFCPVVLLPVIGRNIEQTGVAAVGHRVPVLAAEERRGDLDRFAALLTFFQARRTLTFVLDRATGFQVNAACPGDVVDKREGVHQLAVFAVNHIEEAVAVGVGRRGYCLAVLLVVEQHQLVVAGEVPGVVRGVLVEPFYLARGGVDADLPGGVETVVVVRVAIFRSACPAVPGGRVACTDNDGIGCRIEAGALPGRAAAVAPGLDLAGRRVRIIRPGGRFYVAGGGAVFAVQTAHVTFDERAHPYLFAGFRVAGKQLADHTELIAGGAVDQQRAAGGLVLHDGWCAGHGVAGLVVGEFLAPDHLAGVLVERNNAGIKSTEEHLVSVDGGAAVDHVAARADVVGQAMRVAPQSPPGFGVKGEHARVGAGYVDHAIMDDGLGFLTALLFITEGEGPRRRQFEHVLVVDHVQRAVALGVRAQAVHQHVVGGHVVVGDVLPGNRGGRSRARDEAEASGEYQAPDGLADGLQRGKSCCFHGSFPVDRWRVQRGLIHGSWWAWCQGADTENSPGTAGKLPVPVALGSG